MRYNSKMIKVCIIIIRHLLGVNYLMGYVVYK